MINRHCQCAPGPNHPQVRQADFKMTLVPTPVKLRPADSRFKASLDYIVNMRPAWAIYVRSCPKQNNNNTYDLSPGHLQRSRRGSSISLPSRGPSFSGCNGTTPVLRTTEYVCKAMKKPGARGKAFKPRKASWKGGGICPDTDILERKQCGGGGSQEQ